MKTRVGLTLAIMMALALHPALEHANRRSVHGVGRGEKPRSASASNLTNQAYHTRN